jgi:tetratricopeptide (TPR) repeat protein
MIVTLPRCLLVLLVTVLAARVAYAEDVEMRSAKRHFERGQKLFNLGKFDDALDHYQQAYEAKPLPAFLFNIGQCYRNLGDYDAAIFSFKKYLKLSPDAENREQVEDYITELEAEQEKGNSKKFRFEKDDPPETASAPIYKKWWFWTGVAVVGVAGGVGIYAATRSSDAPMTTLDHPPIVFN